MTDYRDCYVKERAYISRKGGSAAASLLRISTALNTMGKPPGMLLLQGLDEEIRVANWEDAQVSEATAMLQSRLSYGRRATRRMRLPL